MTCETIIPAQAGYALIRVRLSIPEIRAELRRLAPNIPLGEAVPFVGQPIIAWSIRQDGDRHISRPIVLGRVIERSTDEVHGILMPCGRVAELYPTWGEHRHLLDFLHACLETAQAMRGAYAGVEEAA